MLPIKFTAYIWNKKKSTKITVFSYRIVNFPIERHDKTSYPVMIKKTIDLALQVAEYQSFLQNLEPWFYNKLIPQIKYISRINTVKRTQTKQ